MSRIVLKLGGSVITDKAAIETLDSAALERAASIIAAHGHGEFVLVHGGGSFGHHHANQYGVDQSTGTRDPTEIRTIHDAMRRLSSAVIEALQAEGIPAVPVAPLASCSRRTDGSISVPDEVLRSMLAEDFVPVLYGDVVVSPGQGVTVLSGDELVVALARALEASRVGLCTTVPGVLDDSGSVIERVTDGSALDRVIGASETTDVTGGMAAKVDALANLESEASIFDLDGLGAFLIGDDPGTTIG
ncbi:MAG: isopentenyl phosphate kinase [Natrialbaceae archaeon]|nr:isopentenyl phosphate kinase [Natrialbaceae archaeon]